ncbi:hypothetical protein ACMHYB_48725 [Sorangium sp. So ce1128]
MTSSAYAGGGGQLVPQVLEDGCEYEVQEGVDPEALRRELFLAAAAAPKIKLLVAAVPPYSHTARAGYPRAP